MEVVASTDDVMIKFDKGLEEGAKSEIKSALAANFEVSEA